MQGSRLLLYLYVLAALSPVGLTGLTQTVEKGEQEGRCPACDWKDDRAFRLESIKSQILSKLRLEQPPNISRDTVKELLPKAPPLQELIDQYDVQKDDSNEGSLEDDDYHATTETVITMATEPDSIVHVEGKPVCCFFKFSPQVQYSRVVKAQLWIHLKPIDQKQTTVTLEAVRLLHLKDGIKRMKSRTLKVEMNSSIGGWQSVDVKAALLNWIQQPESKFGMEILASDSSGRDLAITFPGPGEEGLMQSNGS
ncbi:growth/differentiation factor 8 isoform X2 [Latimeria chalumnae]|uniref:growth/differentiation factor 8 isoform X2 n=1 Tax=Latimeria chalumnae TaxID=7897 RepID=UPI0006D91CD7|nr:PREDICTED: growth/differentiation factor 8 isoform X2 [Latimeria chalumnae]|eukprot:XP_014344162.1 PREDICTED: growth/differentiation factor 8 isoform X2 [Latimeria chalumnae]